VTGHEAPSAVYNHPRIYDILHTPGTADEVDAIELLARRYSPAPAADALRSWLEPACGTGRYLRLLAARAARRRTTIRLVGVDLNEGMLEFARSSVPAARFVRADMRRLTPAKLGGAFDVVFTPQNSVRHLLRDTDLVRHLTGVRSCLRPGGVYLVGTALEPASAFGESDDHYQGRRGSLVVRDDVQYVPIPPRTPRDGDGFEHVHSYVSVWRGRATTPAAEVVSSYRLRCWSPPRWARLVVRSGLEQAAACDLGGTDLGLEYRGYALRVLRRAGTGATRRPARGVPRP
jgi:SAM-dependent methyltransferase